MRAAGPVDVVLNARAGGAGDPADEIRAAFARRGADVRIERLARDLDLAPIVARARADGRGVVVAAGGDGTASAVAGALAGTDVLLGILPAGTRNHFAKDLGLPLDLDDAVAVVLEGTVARVDAAELDGRVFLNNASLGVYPRFVEERLRQGLGRRNPLALLWASLKVLVRWHPHHHVRIVADDRTIETKTQLVLVANNRYAIDGDPSTRPRLDAGELGLYVSRRTGRRDIVRLVVRGLRGRLEEADAFEALVARAVAIETRRPEVRIALDGEVLRVVSPLRFRIRPGALGVLVPAARPDTAP